MKSTACVKQIKAKKKIIINKPHMKRSAIGGIKEIKSTATERENTDKKETDKYQQENKQQVWVCMGVSMFIFPIYDSDQHFCFA